MLDFDQMFPGFLQNAALKVRGLPEVFLDVIQFFSWPVYAFSTAQVYQNLSQSILAFNQAVKVRSRLFSRSVGSYGPASTAG